MPALDNIAEQVTEYPWSSFSVIPYLRCNLDILWTPSRWADSSSNFIGVGAFSSVTCVGNLLVRQPPPDPLGGYSPRYLKLVLTEWAVGLQTIVAARRRTCPTRCRELAALNNCCLYGKLTVSLQLKQYLAEVKRGRGISGSAIGLLGLC